ncbi:hypothetical protein D3OALGA1CA_5305 [Olavius algarvensis associated proteobacterium Delta 3]|nr:hypothetical protein D3OALGB2SA_4978 [Olavius algarvensis associated proteobacterium Delta 3]CAB5164823.1 hypothetical protein D3OALGA1CA_5305 [Olavius algarvensis associated proteobacterium Delta 3]
MKTTFAPECLPLLIGSLPMTDHQRALDLVLDHTPDVPLWVQLPSRPMENMLAQFMPGMPGVQTGGDRLLVDTAGEDFDPALLAFYEDYLGVTDGTIDLNTSRFALGQEEAEGFFVFLERIAALPQKPVAVKGQITGPVTLTTGVSDQGKQAIFYDDRLRDAAVKLLAMKARWQVRQLSQLGCPVILFLDEPAMAGYGTSEFTSISRDHIASMLEEVIEGVHAEGGLAGIHVCANTDWSLVLESPLEIINFDAYAYFDKFILYAAPLVKFMTSGGCIAWGIIPTSDPADIDAETTDSLATQWDEKVGRLVGLGVNRDRIRRQSFVTPSCGTGSIDLDHAKRVLELTREVSDRLKSTI